MSDLLDLKGPYRFLSNFHYAPVKITTNGISQDAFIYASNEHAFQAAKTNDLEARKRFLSITCPEARKLGQVQSLRSNWEEVKLQVMYDLTVQKFIVHSDLRERLLDTGSVFIKEGNTWHDNFWGSCRCSKCEDKGLNNLGQLLMKIRDLLKSSRSI